MYRYLFKRANTNDDFLETCRCSKLHAVVPYSTHQILELMHTFSLYTLRLGIRCALEITVPSIGIPSYMSHIPCYKCIGS